MFLGLVHGAAGTVEVVVDVPVQQQLAFLAMGKARFEVDAIGVGYHVFQAARMGHPAQPLLNRSLPAARSLR